jgi:ABC-type multidrug transport system ATPase subunit
MGESGAGKTTLLNALAGRASYSQMSGELLIDGRLPTADSYRSMGYVQQADCHGRFELFLVNTKSPPPNQCCVIL